MSKRSTQRRQAAQSRTMAAMDTKPDDGKISPPTITANDAYSNPAANLGYGADNLEESTVYPLTRLTYDYMKIISLYRSSGILRRIVNIPVEDACAHWFKIDSQLEPDQTDALNKLIRQTKIKKQIETGLKWGRLFGGSAALIMIDGQADMLDQPLDLKTIEPGGFKGIYVVDRWSGIYPEPNIISDINDSEFGKPEFYNVRVTEDATSGIRVHNSRILRFIGEEVPYWEKQFEQYWGASIIETVYDELKMYDNSRWNISNLLFQANVWIQKTDELSQLMGLGTQSAQGRLWQTMHAQQRVMSSFSTRLIDSKDDLQNHPFTFSGLKDTFEIFMYALSSVTGIPVTKLFGRSASGLDATGDGDMNNYYALLENIQENKIRPVIDQLLPIMCMSEFGGVPDDINISFNPVRVPTEKEKSEIGVAKSTAILAGFTAGTINQKIALKELRELAEPTGMWSNITDEDIDNADDAAEIGDVPQNNTSAEE